MAMLQKNPAGKQTRTLRARGAGGLSYYGKELSKARRAERSWGRERGAKRSMRNSEEHRLAKHVFSMNCGTSQALCAP